MMSNRETMWNYLEADDWNNAFRLCEELGWNWVDVVAQEMRSRALEKRPLDPMPEYGK
jgi:hypothetical protein